jgi:hypothetical protein
MPNAPVKPLYDCLCADIDRNSEVFSIRVIFFPKKPMPEHFLQPSIAPFRSDIYNSLPGSNMAL